MSLLHVCVNNQHPEITKQLLRVSEERAAGMKATLGDRDDCYEKAAGLKATMGAEAGVAPHAGFVAQPAASVHDRVSFRGQGHGPVRIRDAF